MPSVTYPDYRHARLIVVWGANPSSSGIHLIPHIKAAQEAGAALVVIDPRRTNLARRADLHLALKPGTDVVVALAVHRYLFEHGGADEPFLAAHAEGADRLRERCAEWTLDRAAEVAGIDPELLENFAEMYADISPAIIRCGWGLERNRNGGNAALAVLALPAVGGKFGVRGGGYSMSNTAAWNQPVARVLDRQGRARYAGGQHEPPGAGPCSRCATRRSGCCSCTTATRWRRCRTRTG